MQAGQAPCGLSDCADATGYDAVKNEYELMFLGQSLGLPWALQHIVALVPLPFRYVYCDRTFLCPKNSSTSRVCYKHVYSTTFEVKVYRIVILQIAGDVFPYEACC